VQTLPIILAVFAAAAAIIAVLFWRIKPQPVADTEASSKRILEETQKAQALQAKLEANESSFREASSASAAAKATAEAAYSRADAADLGTSQIRFQFEALQKKSNEAEPLVATATARMEAAEKAKEDLVQRLADLTTRHDTLRIAASMDSERAVVAEKDAAAARAEAEAVRQRASAAEARLDSTSVSRDALHKDLSGLKTLAAEANAQRDAAEASKMEVGQRLLTLTQRHDSLQTAYNEAAEQSSASRADVGHLKLQINDMGRTLEAYETTLAKERQELALALAKQQSDEAATRQFENISNTILKETMEEAKRGIEELAASFQKSSGAELEKHADKITRTLEPLQAQLTAYDAAVESLKKGTQENYGSLREQLSELQKTERSLHDQAKALTTALSGGPKVKGAYSEMILKQLVEFVGMQEKCHFETQASRETEQGRRIPDLVVSLPGGQKVLVDAKAVMEACVQAYQTQDDDHRTILLRKHCDNVRARVLDLSSKNYFENHKNAVEAVVLFLPAENLYATALENDAELTEFAMKRNIIICGPNLLMMLLKVANQLWRRASIEEEAQKIKECGDSIYKFACDFVGKYAKLGTKIRQLEDDYNDAAGTLDGRLIPKGREMGKLTAVANGREMEGVPLLRDDIHEYRSAEAKKQIIATTQKLPELVIGDETAELVFSTGTAP